MNKKRLFTKAVSWLLTFVMLVSLVPQTGNAVQAAEEEPYTVTLYFELPEGTNASDWGINAWSNVEIKEANQEIKVRPSDWGEGSQYPALLSKDVLDGWGYATLEGSITGIQFVTNDNRIYECWNAQIANDGLKEAYFAPSTKKWYKEPSKETEITVPEVQDIFVLAGDEALAGSNWDITDKNNFFTKDEDTGTYSHIYKNVVPGTYQYKILQDPENKGWDLPCGGVNENQTLAVTTLSNVTFTVDASTDNKEFTVTQEPVKGLVLESVSVKKGGQTSLVTEAQYYDGENEEPEDVQVTYTLKTPVDGITLEDNIITVADKVTAETVTVIAEYGDCSTELTLAIVQKEYTVTINMYSQDLEMKPGVSDIYIFENGGSKHDEAELTGTYEDEENGVTWVTGTINLSYNNLGIIARDVAGSWDGGQDSNQYYTIPEDTTEVTLWYEYGVSVTAEKPTITKTEQRYFYLDYENKNLGGMLPQFYSWTTGYAAERIDFEDNGNGNYSIKVPVKASCTNVSFVIVLDASNDLSWIKDGGDHFISFPAGQRVVFATIKEGQEPELGAPYNTGYDLQPENDQIAFYYRDDAALIEGTLAELEPKIEIDGTEYPMVWNEAGKQFVYNKTGLKDGHTDYRYHVNDEYVLDKFNSNTETKDGTEYSYVEYYKLNAEINAEVMNPSFNYNENNLVKIRVKQDENDAKTLEVSKATIDVSSLGGSSSMPVEPELMAVTISVTTDTEPGEKTLPITVTDQYSNTYTTNVNVTVDVRVKEENSFDWDESCIYFMVTDRFFDGNEGNNTASDQFLPEDSNVTTTYGKDNEGLYHGGDFAGITQKLDYLEDLGINTIWITPVVENIPGVEVTGEGSGDVPYNAAYHGYWTSDFTKLNPTLGTEEEFKTMIAEAHSRGIKIMVDIVVNHAGYGAEDKFGDLLRPAEDVVSTDSQKGGDQSNLPDFRTEDADVRAKLVEWQTSWMKDYGIDYYRVDTVKHVEGTTWAALKNSTAEANPSFKMIGEYYGAGYASNGETLGTGQMDAILDFDFNDQATNFVTGNISAAESFLAARNEKLNNTYMTGQFLGSHDEDGFKYSLRGKMTEEQAEAAALVAATLQITAKGLPVIYYGEELGQTGANNYPYQTNRYDLDWTKVADNNKTYQHYKKLLAARNAYTDVFARGDRTVVAGGDEDGYDIIKRTYGTDSLFVGMNIKDEEQTVTLYNCGANAAYTDIYAGKTYKAGSEGKLTITLPKSSDGGTVILAKDKVSENTPAPPLAIFPFVPSVTQPADTSPVPSATPADIKPTVTPAAETQPTATAAPVAEAQPTVTPAAEVQPAITPPANTEPAVTPPAETQPAATAAPGTTTVKKVTIKSVTNNKTKKMVIKWKKLGGVKGYQVQYSKTKNFKTKKSININKAAVTQYTVKKLKKNKTYYVRIRAFKKADGKKVYGQYSTIKKVKIKK